MGGREREGRNGDAGDEVFGMVWGWSMSVATAEGAAALARDGGTPATSDKFDQLATLDDGSTAVLCYILAR